MNSLTHLDQIIDLDRGDAGQLWWAISDCGRRNLVRLQHQLGAKVETAGVVVALPALARVAKRLKRIDERELHHVGLPRRKPVKFRLKVDELVAIMLYVQPRALAPAWVVMGKVHHVSLNLDQFIAFT